MAHDLTPSRELRFGVAGDSDAAELVAMHIAVARDLTVRFGRGHWSFEPTQKSVGRAIVTSRVVVARLHGAIAGSFELQTKKPWAIDRTYFTDAPRPLYLLAMAVTPSVQRQGIGRRLLDEAVALARDWPAGAIRLDAYDGDAGAGPFYAKCGFTEIGRFVYRGTPLVYFELLLDR